MAARTQALDAADLPLPPGPPALPLIGQTISLGNHPLETLQDGALRYGDLVRFRFGPWDAILINKPEHIRHVLISDSRNYPKSPSYRALRIVLGDGLLTSEGELWKRQRKLAQPAFHRERLRGFVDTFARVATDHAAGWAARAQREPLDIHRDMQRLTLRSVGLTLFSADLQGDARSVGEAVEHVLDRANSLGAMLSTLVVWIPTPGNRRFRRSLKVLDELVQRLIGERRRAGVDGEDLLGMLMGATDETGTARMSDRQLRDEVMTLILAGHETVANALTWTFYLLAQHPGVVQRLRGELDEVLGDRAAPSFEDLPKLGYVDQVLDESLRLYPPAWVFERQALVDDAVGGYRIPKGALAVVSPWTLHRSPTLWPHPERFDPDRFTPQRVAERHRFAFLPFGAGPRQCIGNNFALMEAKVMLSILIRGHAPELLEGHRVEPEASITLRPKHGVQVVLRRA